MGLGELHGKGRNTRSVLVVGSLPLGRPTVFQATPGTPQWLISFRTLRSALLTDPSHAQPRKCGSPRALCSAMRLLRQEQLVPCGVLWLLPYGNSAVFWLAFGLTNLLVFMILAIMMAKFVTSQSRISIGLVASWSGHRGTSFPLTWAIAS